MNLLQDIVMWFSSGGTSSVLHNDNVDNINCLFSGSKDLYMVDKVCFHPCNVNRWLTSVLPEGKYSRQIFMSADKNVYKL